MICPVLLRRVPRFFKGFGALMVGWGLVACRAPEAEVERAIAEIQAEVVLPPAVTEALDAPASQAKPYRVLGGLSPFDPLRLAQTGPKNAPLTVSTAPWDMGSGARARQPLEAFPLDSMSMVGVWQQGRQIWALLWAQQSLYRVRVGDRLGPNAGLVTAITPTGLTVREWLLSPSGGQAGSERLSTLELQKTIP